MQERRATVRTTYCRRTEYCPSEDLIPRDGRIVNLSERGLGLWTGEAHPQGERMTVSFSIPGEDEPVTLTGVVRWSEAGPSRRWYPVGLEWFPLEETIRYRLRTFLSDSAQPVGGSATRQGLIQRVSVVFGVFAGFGIALWVGVLQQENRQLATAIEQRNAMIRQLEHREQLWDELTSAKTSLVRSTQDVAQLDQQVGELVQTMGQLNQQVGRFRPLPSARPAPMDPATRQILGLEPPAANVERLVTTFPQLPLVVREALESRLASSRQEERHQ